MPGPPAGPPSGSGGPPVCPRHPDRESYVRCQRCERPTCPECQREAPVGVQCVDCVRLAARQSPSATTAFGGTVRSGRPVVTLTVMGLCLVVYLLQRVSPDVTLRFAFAPALAAVEPWRFLTAAFLHSPGSLLHIGFNLYALYLTGPFLEQVLGRVRFAALYLLSALGGSVGYLVLTGPTAGFTVGASGAVFGLFAALLVVQRRLGRRSGQIVGLLVINFVLGLVVPNIAWQAHLGGLLTGGAVAAALVVVPGLLGASGSAGTAGLPSGGERRAAQRRRDAVQLGGALVVLGVLVVLAVVRLSLEGFL